MVELVFVACLLSSQDECQDRSLLFADISPMVCMIQAQSQLAEWAEAHPGWTIRRWSCQNFDRRHADI